MPVAASDLVAYAAASMPDDDVSTSGGAIDLLRYVDFTPIAADDDLEVVSDDAADTTQTATLEGRLADGSLGSEVVTLDGTTPVVFSTLGVIERVLSFELSTAAAGTVTLRRSVGGATVRVLAAGQRGFVSMFRKAASEANPTDRYEKFFWKNEHATLALASAEVKQSADPQATITHALATAVDDTGSVTNRKTAPAGLVFDDTAKTVPGGSLGAGETIGVWLRLTRAGDAPAVKDTYTSEIAGTST
jgi:hypothetical protein